MNPQLLTSIVVEFFEKLGVEVESITLLGGNADSDPQRRASRTVIAVVSPHSKALIGPHGEHLRALNMIVRRLVEQKHSEGEAAGFLIDVNGYHEEQMEKVRQSARMLAQRARLFKRDFDMDPMSAYERLVIHELFAEDPEIKTESAGEGKFRHIVLRYKTNPAYAAAQP